MKYETESQLLEEMLARDEASRDELLSDREREAFPDVTAAPISLCAYGDAR